jgi:hypothetical protein
MPKLQNFAVKGPIEEVISPSQSAVGWQSGTNFTPVLTVF